MNELATIRFSLYFLCMFVHSDVQHFAVVHLFYFLCCAFLFCLSSSFALSPMLPVSLDCPLLIAPSVFSNVYSETSKLFIQIRLLVCIHYLKASMHVVEHFCSICSCFLIPIRLNKNYVLHRNFTITTYLCLIN